MLSYSGEQWQNDRKSVSNKEHLRILHQGVSVWNDWRQKNPEVHPDLSEANLFRANLVEANLVGANLRQANLREADFTKASLSEADLGEANLFAANLSEADLLQANLQGAKLGITHLEKADLRAAQLSGAYLWMANLTGADLRSADLGQANLYLTNLSEAKLWGASLSGALLIETDLRGADLRETKVYGTSVWKVKIDERTKQQNLFINDHGEAAITVDNIKVAQFIYLLLNNQEIRTVIDTITSKAVLILGSFSDERKPVLDAIRDELRQHDYLPIMFDFQPSANQTPIETITTLARMARFVIADLTDARSVLQELEAIVPDLPSLAVRLMIKKSAHEYGMLGKIRKYPWVIKDTYKYENAEEVIASIKKNVIGPAEEKVKKLRNK
jgi:hypothetical protein